MAKGTKLSEFKKGEITALKRVGKSQWEILKVLEQSNSLKSPNKYETKKKKKQLAGQKNYHHNSREELFAKWKRKLGQNQKYWNL